MPRRPQTESTDVENVVLPEFEAAEGANTEPVAEEESVTEVATEEVEVPVEVVEIPVEEPVKPKATRARKEAAKEGSKGGKYTMLLNVKHDGTIYEKDAVVDLEDSEAELFIEKGFVDPVKVK